MAKKEPIVRECDVLVVGGGLAGCFAAIRAKQAGAEKVIQLDKGKVGYTGCSAFGAGMIAAFDPNTQEYDPIFKDIVLRQDYLLDQERLEDHLKGLWPCILDMDSWGVEFEKNPDGSPVRLYGRGSTGAVLFHGPQMMAALGKIPRKMGVEQINKVMLTDLLTNDGRCVGATALDFVTGDFIVFKSKATILCTGSCRYKGKEPMQRNVTGDGQAAAYRAGVDVSNADMVGRNAFSDKFDVGPGMYISTGSGAIFRNRHGVPILSEYYDKERGNKTLFGTYIPAFSAEVRMGDGPIYIDLTHFPPETVQMMKRTLPIPLKMYERIGVVKGDKFITKIEWALSSPRLQSGPLVNRKMETTLPGLYSTGDCIPQSGSEGGQVHMGGAVSSGAIAGKNAAAYVKGVSDVKIDMAQVEEHRKVVFAPAEREDGIEPDQVALSTLDVVAPYQVLALTNEDNMKKALKDLEDIREYELPLIKAYDPHYLRMAFEARNMILCAEIQTKSVLHRTESRKATIHIREDYPYTDNVNWLKWVSAKDENGKMKMFTQDLPVDTYPIKPEKRGKYLAPVWQTLLDRGKIKIEEGKVKWV